MDGHLLTRARRALGIAAAVAVLTTLAGTPAALGKTTKKKVATKKAAATTVKRSTATTAPRAGSTANTGPAKNIVGVELAPGEPIKLGLNGANPTEGAGNIERMFEIALDTHRKNGNIPIHGRDVVPYWRGYDVTTTNPAATIRGMCTALAQDDKVFAAVLWYYSPECLASDFKIPAIGSQITDEGMARAFPYAFASTTDFNAILRNVPAWADDLGILKGRKLGVYHTTNPGRKDTIEKHFVSGMKKLGHSIEAIGGNDDAADRVAVQRFKSAGVNTIFLMGTRPAEFGRAAQAQGFKPKYVFAATETAQVCDGCPGRLGLSPTLFDGSYAMSAERVGENGFAGNPAPNQAGVDCATNYEKLSGERVRQQGTAFEAQRWQAVQITCVQVTLMINALKAAGPKLTQGALINALETPTQGVPSGLYPDIRYTRTSHFGTLQVRTLQLDGECLCWKVRTPLHDPFVD